jgi:uncharacterized membrane protein
MIDRDMPDAPASPAHQPSIREDARDGPSSRSLSPEEIEEGRAAAILAYVPFGCFVALVRFRDNAFAMRHGKQGLLLTFFEVLAGIFLIPRLSEYFWVTVVFACLASAVTGIYFALQGREWTIPVVGKWFEERVDIDRIPRSADGSDLE